MNGESGQTPTEEAGITQEATKTIDPQILEELGLNQDDLERYNEATLKEKREILAMKQKGEEHYREVAELRPDKSYRPAAHFGNFAIGLENKTLPEIPDAVLESCERQANRQPEQKQLLESKLKAFCEGFGEEALAARDYNSAVNAFDISTEDGILQNEQVMNQLKQASQSDKTTGVKIAEAIQARLDKRQAHETHQKLRDLPPDENSFPVKNPEPAPAPEIPTTPLDTPEPTPTPPQETPTPIPTEPRPTETPSDLRPAPPPPEQPQ